MNKRLGQNFLVNQSKIHVIVDALDLKDGDFIIEIGPGHGELTKELGMRSPSVAKALGGKKDLRIIGIEKDPILAQLLSKNFQFLLRQFDSAHCEQVQDPESYRGTISSDKVASPRQSRDNFQLTPNSQLPTPNNIIIEGDALKVLPAISAIYQIQNTKYKVVGNIPYYITGRLLRVISELKIIPGIIVLTVQKEVAERLTAKPPKMNLLAACVQFWADVEIIDFIPKKDFRPMPKVDSAVVRLTTARKYADEYPEASASWRSYGAGADLRGKYYQLIKILFKQPRKTILNNLAFAGIKKSWIQKELPLLKINPEDRPQSLNIDDIKKIALHWYNKKDE